MHRLVCLFVISLLGSACAGRSWPEVNAITSRSLAERTVAVRTVDVLPVDLAVMKHARSDAGYTQEILVGTAYASLTSALQRRGYRIGALMGPDGSYEQPGGARLSAMDPAAVQATVDSLSLYGMAQAEAGAGTLLVPYLPAALGQRTGSDATLYVGGWSYLGKDPSNGGGARKAAKWTVIAIAAVVVVATVAVLAKKAPGGNAVSAAGQGIARAARPLAHAVARTSYHAARFAGRLALATLDGFGRSHTHLHLYSSNHTLHPYQLATTNHESRYENKVPPSAMEIELTLIDNRTGHVLWHGRQRFHATSARASDVREVFRRMTAGLPAAR